MGEGVSTHSDPAPADVLLSNPSFGRSGFALHVTDLVIRYLVRQRTPTDFPAVTDQFGRRRRKGTRYISECASRSDNDNYEYANNERRHAGTPKE
jgi:hypothetical protein